MTDTRRRAPQRGRRTGRSGQSHSNARSRRMMRRRRRRMQILARLGILAAAVALIVFAGVKVVGALRGEDSVIPTAANEPEVWDKVVPDPPDYDVQLLTVNPYSRPGDALTEVKGVVVHWTANPGTTAAQNRSYFESLKDTHETSASSHFVIGMEGEVVQCIPCNEVAYASNERNGDTIAIECCIPDETGRFTDETYQTLVHLVAWLCGRYELGTEDVIRHYDITGKDCPKYFVEHEDKWEQFKKDVNDYIETNGVSVKKEAEE